MFTSKPVAAFSRSSFLPGNLLSLLLLVILIPACTPVAKKDALSSREISISKELDVKKIAYLRFTEGFWQVWMTDTAGSFHEQLTHDDVDKSRISWSSGANLLLVNANDGTLLLLNRDTRGANPLRLDALGVFDAQISTDGTQMVYTATTSLQADNAEVWVADLDGNNKKKITNNTAVTLSPSWNPNDNSILYSAGAPGKNQELWRASLEENAQNEQLTVSPFSSVDPNANGAGNILYSSDRTGYYNIWLLDKTLKPVQITHSPSYDAQPDWNQSGTAFVFFRILNNKKQIWLHDTRTGKEVAITPDAVLSRGAVWMD